MRLRKDRFRRLAPASVHDHEMHRPAREQLRTRMSATAGLVACALLLVGAPAALGNALHGGRQNLCQ